MPRSSNSWTPGGSLLAEDAHRIRAADAAARCEGVLDMQGDVVVGRDGGCQPALRPVAGGLRQRRARDQRHAGRPAPLATSAVKSPAAPAPTTTVSTALYHGRVARQRRRSAGVGRAVREAATLTGRGGARAVRYPHREPATVPGRPWAAPCTYITLSSLEHDTGDHPEQPARITAIERELESRDWLGYERELAAPARAQLRSRRCTRAPTSTASRRSASREAGCSTWTRSRRRGRSMPRSMRRAARCARLRRCCRGEAEVAFCGLRPPGHHAEAARAMGFCLFNNAAIAARRALDGLGAERVLVLDWDVHHGNGTNDIFYDTDEVLYVSIHQSPLYPGTGHAAGERGRGRRGVHGQPAGSPGSGPRGLAVALRARGRAGRPRVCGRTCCSCRPASTPTATTRWRTAS